MADIEWDENLLRPRSITPPQLVSMNTTSGRSLSGSEEIISTGAGYWQLTYRSIRVRTKEQIIEWNRIQGASSGRAKTILVPILDGMRAPRIASPRVQTDDATLGGVDLQIAIDPQGEELKPGQHFSHTASERLYRLVTVTKNSPVSYTVTVTPPFRSRPAITDVLEFADPRLKMRLADDEQMMGLELDLWKRGNGPSVTFVEALP